MYETGMDQWLASISSGPDPGRVGLVCHAASVNAFGTHSSLLLRERLGDRLVCLLGPEHGVFSAVPPGKPVPHTRHPEWGIPVWSLYGGPPDKLKELAGSVDTLVFDLQDIGVRCYTYLHTLRQVLELGARYDLNVVITDRAIPLGQCVDGPLRDTMFHSVVAPAPLPFVYGMTPGECANWLKQHVPLDVRLTSVSAQGYQRTDPPERIWTDWVPPSPAIRSALCACAFPVTVFTEGLKQFGCSRSTVMAFRVLQGGGLQVERLLESLVAYQKWGAWFAPYHDVEQPDRPAIQLRITDLETFRPAALSVALIHALQTTQGKDTVWRGPDVNTLWFDKLWGTDRVRLALMDGLPVEEIVDSWDEEISAFRHTRQSVLLY